MTTNPPFAATDPQLADDTRTKILAAAVELVEERGEAGLRVVEVGERAGVSTASLYTYFTNRDDLVVEVRVQQYVGEVTGDVEFFGEMVQASTSGPDLVRRMREVTRAMAAPERKEIRWRRAEVLGAARRRPHLAERLAHWQRQVNAELAGHIRAGQERGLIKPDFDPLALSVFVQGYTLGLILDDIDPHSPLERDAWIDVVTQFTGSVAAE